MLEAFFGAVFVGLILLGVLAVAYAIMFKMLMPKEKFEYYIVIPSAHCGTEITAAAYSARTKLNLMGDGEKGKVFILDMGMSEAEKLSCLNVCRKSNGIFCVTAEEIEEILR